MSPLARDRINLAVNEWNNSSTQTYKTSMGMRAVIYGNTLDLVRARPWFGTGTGGYGAAYTAQISGKSSDWRAVPTVDPHSQYLFFLAEQGIFGLLAFLGFIAAALADRGDSSRARIVAVGMLLGWCATSLLSSHFKTFSEGHLLTFFLGAMLARPVAASSAHGVRTFAVIVTTVLVRLPNHVGDACMALPALNALITAGLDCALVGRPWGASLLAGIDAPYQPITGRFLADRRAVRNFIGRIKRDGDVRGLVLPNSVGSALLFALVGVPSAGLAAIGSGRRALLRWPVPEPRGRHEVERFHAAACGALAAWGRPAARAACHARITSDSVSARRSGCFAARLQRGALCADCAGGHGTAPRPGQALDALR